MSIFSGIGETLSDVKFKVSHLGVKQGAGDEAFETQRHSFEKYEKHIKALVKSMEKLEKAFKDVGPAVLAMSTSLSAFYEDDDDRGAKYKVAASTIEMGLSEFLAKFKVLRDRVEDHEKQLALAKKKIAERDRLKLEYDKQSQELEKLKAKTQTDPLKIPQRLKRAKLIAAQAESRWQMAKDNYEREHTPLLEELTTLNASRYQDFDTEYKTLAALQVDLFTRCVEGCDLLESYATDSSSLRAPPPAVKPRSASVEAEPKGSPRGAEPPKVPPASDRHMHALPVPQPAPEPAGTAPPPALPPHSTGASLAHPYHSPPNPYGGYAPPDQPAAAAPYAYPPAAPYAYPPPQGAPYAPPPVVVAPQEEAPPALPPRLPPRTTAGRASADPRVDTAPAPPPHGAAHALAPTPAPALASAPPPALRPLPPHVPATAEAVPAPVGPALLKPTKKPAAFDPASRSSADPRLQNNPSSGPASSSTGAARPAGRPLPSTEGAAATPARTTAPPRTGGSAVGPPPRIAPTEPAPAPAPALPPRADHAAPPPSLPTRPEYSGAPPALPARPPHHDPHPASPVLPPRPAAPEPVAGPPSLPSRPADYQPPPPLPPRT